MYKRLLAGVLLLAVLTALLAACSIHEAGGPSGPTVHMSSGSFDQDSITVKKGESISIIDDVAVVHIIKNGFWKDATADEAKESGAPVYNQTFNGNDSGVLGPFSTSGTFHYYCTVHPGMNLTVVVS